MPGVKPVRIMPGGKSALSVTGEQWQPPIRRQKFCIPPPVLLKPKLVLTFS